MKKISIAVDLDSTLNNLDQIWILKDYNERWGDSLTMEDMTEWDTHNYVKPECGKKVYEFLKEPGYFRNLGLRDEHTKAGFEWLCEQFEVYIVSSCAPETVLDKVEWLREFFPAFDVKRFIACHPKGLINTDWLIDDGPHNIEEFKQKSVLIDAAYNRYLDEEKHDFTRVMDWSDIRSHFEVVLEEYKSNEGGVKDVCRNLSKQDSRIDELKTVPKSISV